MSSTDAFVAAIAPKLAMVSVGEGHQFDHPVDAVMERYAAVGARFSRTDRDGAVTALPDGQTADGSDICRRTSAVDAVARRRDGQRVDSGRKANFARVTLPTLARAQDRSWYIPRSLRGLFLPAIPIQKSRFHGVHPDSRG